MRAFQSQIRELSTIILRSPYDEQKQNYNGTGGRTARIETQNMTTCRFNPAERRSPQFSWNLKRLVFINSTIRHALGFHETDKPLSARQPTSPIGRNVII